MDVLKRRDEVFLVLSVALINVLHDIKNTIYIEPILFNCFKEVSNAVIHFFVDVFVFGFTTFAFWR